MKPSPADVRQPGSARDRIVATAHELFYRDGIRATGVDRVIARAGVTKVTFYRHFPSKDDLVDAFLAHRHALWMHWFTDALRRHAPRDGDALRALPATMREWFAQPGYRGCAFVNSVGELGDSEAVVRAARRHKADMTRAIATLLPPGAGRARDARALSVAVDGAIVRAQFDGSARDALAGLTRLVDALRADSRPGL